VPRSKPKKEDTTEHITTAAAHGAYAPPDFPGSADVCHCLKSRLLERSLCNLELNRPGLALAPDQLCRSAAYRTKSHAIFRTTRTQTSPLRGAANFRHTMSTSSRSDGFTCITCKQFIPTRAWGTSHRNHCPFCLWSRHLDEQPGDRRAPCRGPMQPIGVEVRRDGEWAIIHRCTSCNALRA
jgi:hypothetical protein